MSKEPNKDFRQAVWRVIIDAHDERFSDQEATTRILALCKEMLVPYVDKPRMGSENYEIYAAYANGWNRCRQHLLKQLGEKI